MHSHVAMYRPPSRPDAPSAPGADGAPSPGTGGFSLGQTPRFSWEASTKKISRETGPYSSDANTVGVLSLQSSRNYASSFGTMQQRWSQLNHAQSIAQLPVPWVPSWHAGTTATEEVSPSSYDASMNAIAASATDADRARGRITLAARTVFRSDTPQLTLFASRASTPAFARSGAKNLGPGSYKSTNGSELCRSTGNSSKAFLTSRGDGHRSAFVSRRPQQSAVRLPVSAETAEPNRFKPSLVERASLRASPSARGHTWSPAPRVTKIAPCDGVAREPGRDQFYAGAVNTMAWDLVGRGLHTPHADIHARARANATRRARGQRSP